MSINIKTIHSMRWGSAAHDVVVLDADTDTGDHEQIGTPYDETSIIWEAVSAFPVDQIQPFVPPESE
jgi:hypothetical protein